MALSGSGRIEDLDDLIQHPSSEGRGQAPSGGLEVLVLPTLPSEPVPVSHMCVVPFGSWESSLLCPPWNLKTPSCPVA